MSQSKTLYLTLSKKPFEVMVTGEKSHEYRTASDWIKQRLIGKEYDGIHFVNGYGKDKPYFKAEYIGYKRSLANYEVNYSNGLNVQIQEGDYVIKLGQIIERGNLDMETLQQIDIYNIQEVGYSNNNI